jgi:hypothetical protein
VRTPDRAQISVKASITFIPGIKDQDTGNVMPESLIVFLNSGGEDGVRKIIHDIVEDRVKTWAGSNKEGPADWMEAQNLKDDAHGVLAKSLLGDSLPNIESEIPTSTWMRFFDRPQSEPSNFDASPRNGWAQKDEDGNWNWDGLQAIFDGYSPEEQDDLRDKINDRRRSVRALREGKALFGDESLGITIVRFTVNEIKVQGKVAEAAELQEKERRERAADTVEMQNVSERVAELTRDHKGLTAKDAFQIVQVERGKVGKRVIEINGASGGLGTDLIAALSGGLGGPSAEPSDTKNHGGGKRKRPSEMTPEELARWKEEIRKKYPPRTGD